MADVVFSPEAIDDLKQIKKYIAEELQNSTAALKTVGEILKNIKRLENFPLIGAPLTSVIGVETDYRYIISGSYVSFYKFDNEKVHIVRILYARRDFIRVLFS